MGTSLEVKVCSLVAILCFALTVAWPSAAYGLGDDEAHAGLSFGATTVSYIALRSYGLKKYESLFTAAAVATIVAMGKELGDDRPSPTDMNANMAGVGAAVGLIFIFDWF